MGDLVSGGFNSSPYRHDYQPKGQASASRAITNRNGRDHSVKTMIRP